jgi:hypothetical protein
VMTQLYSFPGLQLVAADWKGKGKVTNGVGIIVGKESLHGVLEVHNVSDRNMWLGGCY